MRGLYHMIADLTPGEYLRIYTADHTVDVWVEDSHHHEYREESVIDVLLQNDDRDTTGLYLVARTIPCRPVLHRIPLARQFDDIDSATGGVIGETAHIVQDVDRLTATTSLAKKTRPQRAPNTDGS